MLYKRKDISEIKSKEAKNNSIELHSILDGLIKDNEELVTTLKDKEVIIKQQNETIETQKEQIIKQEVLINSQKTTIIEQKSLIDSQETKFKHINDALIKDDRLVDKETLMFNIHYYNTFILPTLDETYFVLTISIKDIKMKQNILAHVHTFSGELKLTPILWDNNTVKLFIHIVDAKNKQLQQDVSDLKKIITKDTAEFIFDKWSRE